MVPVRKFIESYLLQNPFLSRGVRHIALPVERYVDHMAYFESLGYTRVYLKLPIPLQVEAEGWCMDNIGFEHFDRTGITWWFDRPEDATLFALRWS